MATRVMAIAVSLIDADKATALNSASGLDLTAAQWQAAFGVLMADTELRGGLEQGKAREQANNALLQTLQSLRDTAVNAGIPQYEYDALQQMVTDWSTATSRAYNPATDDLANDDQP